MVLAEAEKEDVSRVERVAELLNDLDDVEATVHEQRRPIRLSVEIQANELLPGVRDVFDEYSVVIEHVAAGDNGLSVSTYLAEDFEYISDFVVRTHGNSVVVTIPPKAQDVSGIGVRDSVDVFARPGEIRIRPDE